MKKRFLILCLMFLSFGLVSCNNIEKQDFGIIKGFYVKDQTIYWDDLEGVKEYYIEYYYLSIDQTFGTETDIYLNQETCYVSHTVDYNYYIYSATYLTIEVLYEDGTSEKSDKIQLDYEEPEFLPVNSLGVNQFGTNDIYVLSQGYNEDDFVDYTLIINGDEYTLSSFHFALSNYFTEEELSNSVYEITAIANYTDGSSEESFVYYGYSPEYNGVISYDVDYDTNSEGDLTFEFDEGKIINISIAQHVLGFDGLVAPDGIITVKRDTVTVNKDYLAGPCCITIYTEEHVYRVNVNYN